MQRYFSKDENLNLTDQDKFHIIKVMRMKVDDMIEVVWNNDVYECLITNIDNNDVRIKKMRKININNELTKKITIAFSLVNETKTDLILQKCTELGAYSFIPFKSSRSKIKLDKKEIKKIERWNKVTKEAAEQSYRNIMPNVSNIINIKDLVNLDYDLKIICSTKENEKNIKNIMQNNINCDRIIIVVGPEGGFDKTEEEYLTKNGFISITLGSTILRAETAPIFVMSAFRYELMR